VVIIESGCDDHCFSVFGRNLLEDESMNFKGYSLKSALGAVAIGAAILLGGSEVAFAQDHHQRHERQDLRDHQRRERYYYGMERHQRFERRRFDRRFDRGYGYGRGYGRGYGWGWRRR
jgi:hypothetical protein